MRRLTLLVLLLLGLTGVSNAAIVAEPRTLDGANNNVVHPDWGQAGTQYLRVAAPNYADGRSSMVSGPAPRFVSNRTFNDVGQNLFSENDLSQFAWTWGQFTDHDFGLRNQDPGEHLPIPFNSKDPLEGFRNTFGAIDFFRTPAAPGTGTTSARQQINTISSYIDASGVYGSDIARLQWLRDGAHLILRDGYLPFANDHPNAPPMAMFGAQRDPSSVIVAGDVRANENIALTSMHTLFAREHNRIVDQLPAGLSDEDKFQIARRVVGAEIQYVTYNEFLPALGVQLSAYGGYRPDVNSGLGNEFAAVGYRAHSMIHGEFDIVAPAGEYTQDQLDAYHNQGILIEEAGDEVELEIPLNVAFGNPALLKSIGLVHLFEGLAAERQYKNDEQIDNALRSVLFQVPKPGIRDPSVCAEPTKRPDCFDGVVDLGAIDVQRARDHGMPFYNTMGAAFGLAPKTSFTSITGESSQRFSDPKINRTDPINDPDILEFVRLQDADGNDIPLNKPEAQEEAVTGTRRSTLAARLSAIYGSVNTLDPFVGMVSEKHLSGKEFGELQNAIWKKQFEALRDGDRFFYLNDPTLTTIRQLYGVDYRVTLADVIRTNTGAVLQANAFKATG